MCVIFTPGKHALSPPPPTPEETMYIAHSQKFNCLTDQNLLPPLRIEN